MSDETIVSNPASAPGVVEAPEHIPLSAPDGEDTVPSETPTPAAPAQPTPSHNAVQKRIDALTADKYAAQAELVALKRELDELRRPQQAQAEVPPKRLDFETDEAWSVALADWQEKRIAAKWQDRQRQEAEQAQQVAKQNEVRQQVVERWNGMEEAARKVHPDYDDLVGPIGDFFTQELAAAVIQSPLGAEVVYHLAKHPHDLLKLRRMDGYSAAREIGKLEFKLEGMKHETSAEPPIEPVRPKAVVTQLSDAMSDEAWIQRRQELVRRKR